MTTLITFGDLKARGIFTNRMTLMRGSISRLPPGIMITPNRRAWSEAEVERWLAAAPSTTSARPTARPKLREWRMRDRSGRAAMTGISSPEIERARQARVEDVVENHGIRLRGKIDRCGPCPVCGGIDRFAINTRKQIFNCRGCGGSGDAIALVQHIEGCSFKAAVEKLMGAGSWRASRIAAEPCHREDEAKRAHANVLKRWSVSVNPRGTLAETYLRS